MSAGEDLADVDRVLAGDVAAFEGLVRRWQRPLVNLAYRFCRDRGHAEDMAQEAFVRAFRGLSRWRRESAFSTWLFALALNVYRSELRRMPAACVSLDRMTEPADTEAASDDLEEEDRARAVRRAVHTLPPKYREAMVLFYFHGMNVTDAAASLGVPEGSVKARLSRGRDLLRRKLPRRSAVPSLGEA